MVYFVGEELQGIHQLCLIDEYIAYGARDKQTLKQQNFDEVAK